MEMITFKAFSSEPVSNIIRGDLCLAALVLDAGNAAMINSLEIRYNIAPWMIDAVSLDPSLMLIPGKKALTDNGDGQRFRTLSAYLDSFHEPTLQNLCEEGAGIA